MSAEFVGGTTFAQGGTYTAGHFNDNLRLATVAGIDRSNVNFTLGVLITRDGNQPPAPTDKELWADSSGQDVVSTFFTGAFVPSFRGTSKLIFNVGNGSASSGAAMQTSQTNPIGGIPVVGLSSGIDSNVHRNDDIVGVAYRANATESGAPRVFMATAGVFTVKVTGTVVCGDWLRILGPSGTETPNGTFIVNNNRRNVGLDDPPHRTQGYLLCQAINNKTTSGAGTVLAKIFT